MILFLFLQNKFEAIHNKDYSVVKTFKAALDSFFRESPSFFIILNHPITQLSQSIQISLKTTHICQICKDLQDFCPKDTLYMLWVATREILQICSKSSKSLLTQLIFVRFVKICKISVRRTLLCLNAFSFPQRTRYATSLWRKILRNECNYISKMLYICVILEMNYFSSFFTQLSHQ